jgi:tetratricopeptide (TPR) repeat protein
MLTIKKRRRLLQILAFIPLASLTACGPPGPRDLRKGEALIESGQCAAAIPVLNEGLQLLSPAPPVVRARAWNLLGLAYQGSGQMDAASRAYLEALKLDRNLWAADYNLGCLRMEQTNFPGAIDYLTTYTTSHPKDYNGFLLLGRARLKLALEHPGPDKTRQLQLDNARLDYEYAEKLHSSPEACNALGVITVLRRNQGIDSAKTAVTYFKKALKHEPHYPPAMLNLAIVAQTYLNDPRQALEAYRDYLALQPAPPQAGEVEKLAHQLDLSLRIIITPHGAEHPAPAPTVPVNSGIIRQTPAPLEVQNPKPISAPVTRPAPAERPAAPPQYQPPPPNPSPVVAHVPSPQFSVASSSATPPPVSRTKPSSPPTNPSPEVTASELPVVPPPEEKKHTLAKKLNPLNWFSGKSKKTEVPETAVPADVGSGERYNYPLPVTPIPGDRKLAERLTSEGRQAEHQSNRKEAMRDYQEALKADPTYYEAGLSLGLVAIDAKEYSTALDALSQALTVQENSADARYAFAWVLSKRGYYQDAANELGKLLSARPREVRARLLLGNIYADNLGQPRLAREQYLQALELVDPQSSQATLLRAWLEQHP